MSKSLRAYLESLGLRSDSTSREAWAFYHGLNGERQLRARAIKAGEPFAAPAAVPPAAPPAPPTPPAGATPPTPPDPAPVARAASVTPQDPDAIRAAAVQAERTRVRELREMAGDAVEPELLQRAIDDGWDTNRGSREFLTAIRSSRSPAAPQDNHAPAAIVRDHARDCTRDALTVGLMHRIGVPVIDPNASDSVRARQERLAEQAQPYRDLSAVDICREALRLAGRPASLNRQETIRAAVSTSELQAIFGGVTNRALMLAYEDAPDTTVGWTREVDVPDFKTNDRFLIGKDAGLKRLPRGGSAQHAAVGNAKESYAVARYAHQFVVDEQDLIDDDLGALSRIPEEMGMAAARVRPDLCYAILLANAALNADSVALFHATHANLGTGAGSVLSSAALQTGLAAMAKQTLDGVKLNLMAAFLIVPQDLRFTAMELVNSSTLVVAGTTDAVRGSRNVIADLNLSLAADGRIGVAGVTDPASETAYAGTATNWFLAAAGTNTIEVGYLAGSGRRPMLRSFALSEGQWGIGFDVKIDVGAKALDFRGLYKSAGA